MPLKLSSKIERMRIYTIYTVVHEFRKLSPIRYYSRLASRYNADDFRFEDERIIR